MLDKSDTGRIQNVTLSEKSDKKWDCNIIIIFFLNKSKFVVQYAQINWDDEIVCDYKIW